MAEQLPDSNQDRVMPGSRDSFGIAILIPRLSTYLGHCCQRSAELVDGRGIRYMCRRQRL